MHKISRGFMKRAIFTVMVVFLTILFSGCIPSDYQLPTQEEVREPTRLTDEEIKGKTDTTLCNSPAPGEDRREKVFSFSPPLKPSPGEIPLGGQGDDTFQGEENHRFSRFKSPVYVEAKGHIRA